MAPQVVSVSVSASVTVSGRGIRNAKRKQPKTRSAVSILFSLTRSFAPHASTGPRLCTARLSFTMDDKTRESTPERLAVSEKRKDRRDRKKVKQQAQANPQPAPQQQPNNGRFLARPWINLPEIDEALVKDRVWVMSWNVCPIVPGRYLSKLSLGSSCWHNLSSVR